MGRGSAIHGVRCTPSVPASRACPPPPTHRHAARCVGVVHRAPAGVAPSLVRGRPGWTGAYRARPPTAGSQAGGHGQASARDAAPGWAGVCVRPRGPRSPDTPAARPPGPSDRPSASVSRGPGAPRPPRAGLLRAALPTPAGPSCGLQRVPPRLACEEPGWACGRGLLRGLLGTRTAPMEEGLGHDAAAAGHVVQGPPAHGAHHGMGRVHGAPPSGPGCVGVPGAAPWLDQQSTGACGPARHRPTSCPGGGTVRQGKEHRGETAPLRRACTTPTDHVRNLPSRHGVSYYMLGEESQGAHRDRGRPRG
jgi:hypothetical protein